MSLSLDKIRRVLRSVPPYAWIISLCFLILHPGKLISANAKGIVHIFQQLRAGGRYSETHTLLFSQLKCNKVGGGGRG